MVQVAGGILFAFLALGLLVLLLVAFSEREELKRIRYRNEQKHARRNLQEPDKSLREKPGSKGLEGLGEYLERRQAEQEAQQRQEEDRLNQLRTRWENISPSVKQAVDLVNAKLASREMHVTLSPPDFVDRERGVYGVECALNIKSVSSFDMAYEGKQYLVVVDDDGGRLYVGGFHHWKDGAPFPLKEISFQRVADAIADSIKSFLQG